MLVFRGLSPPVIATGKGALGLGEPWNLSTQPVGLRAQAVYSICPQGLLGSSGFSEWCRGLQDSERSHRQLGPSLQAPPRCLSHLGFLKQIPQLGGLDSQCWLLQQGGGQRLRCPGCLAGAAPACCLLRLRPSWSLPPCGGPDGSYQGPVPLLPASCMPRIHIW